MTTKTFIKLLVWAICLLGVVEAGCAMLSAADTILNILGVLLFVVFAFISYKTHCFINIKNSKK